MRDRKTLGIAFLFAISIAGAPSSAQTPTPGPNVNMVSGTRWPGGDPFLQRQNEPSIAISTRNPLHVLGGANDYRTVDLPLTDALPNATLTGDAWLGLFKSFNGGQTWQSTLIPGYPQDQTPEGLASPLKGFTTASDPVVRSGTNGLFYYAGIAFDRASSQGAVFVTRFIDLNNRENGNAAPSSPADANTDPIRYVGTTAVDRTAPGQFLDKPWIAVDVPRAGSPACSLQVSQPGGTVVQNFSAGNVYLVYTKFFLDLAGKPVASQLFFSRSVDCGQSWSAPMPLTATGDAWWGPCTTLDQGATLQVDPRAGFIYVAWRRFHDATHPDSIVAALSWDGGRSFTPGIPLVSYPASPDPLNPLLPSFFDQGTTGTSFRTNAFPALAVDDSGMPGWPGRVYLAWSQRVAPNGDARIMLLDLPGSIVFSPTGITLVPTPLDNGNLTDDVGTLFARGHQFMPQMAFTGGKLEVVYYDLRLDHTLGIFNPASPLFPDALGRFFLETRFPKGELPGSPGAVFGNFISDANPPLNLRRHTLDVVVAEANPGLHPVFTTARVSRYKVGARPGSSVLEQLQVNPPDLPLFKGGTAPYIGDYIDIAGQTFVPSGGSWVFNTAPVRAPVHLAAWTSNQDVRGPRDGNWTNYTPVGLGSRTSLIDGSPVPQCTVGQEGMRNQNIYSSRITEGLAVLSPQNSKPLSPTVQRAFVVVVQNLTNLTRSFRLRLANQPAGGTASFLQTLGVPPTTLLDVTVGAHAGIARPVFAISSNPTDSITVTADEILAPGGSLTVGGLSGFVVLNPDGTVPPLINPEGAPAGTDIASAELYNPDLANPDLANPNALKSALANPDLANPDLANPDLANPDLANPDLANTDLANVNKLNPDLANPDMANAVVSDASYILTNKGNTNASYRIRLVGSAPTSAKLQLILAKRYLTPVAFNCLLVQETQNTVQASVPRPPIVDPASPDLANPDLANPDLANATLSLQPGETAQITIRGNVDLPTMMQIISGLAPVAIAQAANTGTTTPQISAPLFITTARLPDAVVGVPFRAALRAFGGTPPYAFSTDSLPPGLSLDPAGTISGTPLFASNLPGSSIAFQVQDSAVPARTVTRTLTLRIANPLAVTTTTSLPTATQGTSYGPVNFTATGGIGPYSWTPVMVDGMTPNSSGVFSGTPTQTGVFNFTAQVSDSASPGQTASKTMTLNVVPATPPPPPASVLLCDNFNGAGVTQQPNGPPNATTCTLSNRTQITQVATYHWNNGQGATPGTISLQKVGVIDGGFFGPFAAVGSTGQNNVTNAAWLATPNVTVPAGTYAMIDSDPATWSFNTTSSNSGFVRVWGFANPVILTFNSTGSMAAARAGATATPIGNGKILVTGGLNGSNVPQASGELYDPATGNFTSAGTMTGARALHTATLLANGKVLIAGGGMATAELYDPTSGMFVATGSMSKSRSNHTATLLSDGRVLMAGGGGEATAEIYTPGSGTFASALNSMGAARSSHTATLLGSGKVLLVGGEDATSTRPTLASAEYFDPSTNLFAATTNSLATSRELHTATLAGGKVYLIGGRTGSTAGYSFLSSAEVFDPSTGLFSTSTAALNTSRTTHTATLLNNGKVLIAGGFNFGSLTSAEIFNPATAGSFTATGSMSTGRYFHTATLLANGNVVVIGGLNGSTAVSSAEVYVPGP
jgi:hypothetical protein